ncbi:MAG: transporter [Conexibacter sp.]|nr:transporter [Conexibacter sp.]
MRRSLRVRGFPALATSYAINELGDNLGVVALAILVLDRTDSALAVTALFVASKFLTAFAAPALTAGLDHRRISRVLPALYALEAGAFAGLAAIADAFWLPAVLAFAFADGLLALTARGLSRGAIAAVLTPADALREGNALINVIFAVMSAAGPVAAGLIVHEWGVAEALWLDAASFLAVALLLLASARSLPEPEVGVRESWRARVRDGLAYVRGHPTAGRLIAGQSVAILFFTLIIPIEVVYAKETLDSSSLGFGILIAAWGVGILLGSLLFARSRGRPLGSLVLVSTAAIGMGYAVMAGAPTLLVACAGSVLGGTGNGVQWVAVMTALQEAVEDQYQARAAGLLESAAAAVPGIGYLVGGALTAAVSPRLAYAVSAVGVAVVVVVWARRPIVPDRVRV